MEFHEKSVLSLMKAVMAIWKKKIETRGFRKRLRRDLDWRITSSSSLVKHMTSSSILHLIVVSATSSSL
ncbi:unnamed protein product [Cochlearia groenlandica]